MEKLIVVRELAQLEQVKAYIEAHDFIAFDTETTGVTRDSKVIGFSVSAHTDVGYYVVFCEWNTQTQELVELETTKEAQALFRLLVGKKLIAHNAVFDCSMVENNFQVALMPYVHTDTMILAHLLDENRHNGLKELGLSIYGEDSVLEQKEMKDSVIKNGGKLTRDCYELYKADSELLGRYGAKDTILTLKLFYLFVDTLANAEEGLFDFFYEGESMPLLRGPTYDMNTSGLKVNLDAVDKLRGTLEADCLEAKAFIHREIEPHVKDTYPGTKASNTFNIGSSKQLAWLLFIKLGAEFSTLTKEGRNLCKAMGLKMPYAPKDKRAFIRVITEYKDKVYAEGAVNPKTKKMGRAKKVADVWNYLSADKEALNKYANKYKWVARLLEYSKNQKLLTTYVDGIKERTHYGVIRPNFLQHGTTSGRYSCKNPNFQNLPRDDKRVKSCIVARDGQVFVGADYSQLEPRVFASFSQDERLLACFDSGDDFYSVIGMEVFEKYDCSAVKDAPDSFAKKYPKLRNIAKVVALSSTYGTTAPKMAPAIGMEISEAQQVIDDYFERFPKVNKLMLESHDIAMTNGAVTNLFGRPRRIPKAMAVRRMFPRTPHAELPYDARNVLNLSINHRIQSTAASIMNRAAIACWQNIQTLASEDSEWAKVRIVLQVHDELILEGPEHLGEFMVAILKDAMENTTNIPGVKLLAVPTIAKNLADLK